MNSTAEPITGTNSAQPPRSSILQLLKPHRRALTFGLLAVIGESIASLLDPWPLKIVLDNVLKTKAATHGWLNGLILSVAGPDRYAILRFAAIMVLAVAVMDA